MKGDIHELMLCSVFPASQGLQLSNTMSPGGPHTGRDIPGEYLWEPRVSAGGTRWPRLQKSIVSLGSSCVGEPWSIHWPWRPQCDSASSPLTEAWAIPACLLMCPVRVWARADNPSHQMQPFACPQDFVASVSWAIHRVRSWLYLLSHESFHDWNLLSKRPDWSKALALMLKQNKFLGLSFELCSTQARYVSYKCRISSKISR